MSVCTCMYVNGDELIDIPVGTVVEVLSGRAKGKKGVVVKETPSYVYVRVDNLVPPLVRVAKWNVKVIGRRSRR